MVIENQLRLVGYKMADIRNVVCFVANEIHEDEEMSQMQLLTLLQHRPDSICYVPAVMSVALFRLVSIFFFIPV